MQQRFATVALALPFKFHSGATDGLTYTIPAHLEALTQIGVRAIVPIGAKEKTGVIVDITSTAPAIPQKLRDITDVLDASPVFDTKFLEWTKWVAKYYLCSWGEVLETALPQGFKPESKRCILPTTYATDATEAALQNTAPRRAEILHHIRQHPDGVLVESLQRELPHAALYAALHELEQSGIIKSEQHFTRTATRPTELVASFAPPYALGTDALMLELTSLERTAPKQAEILLALIEHTQRNPTEPITVKALRKRTGASAKSFEQCKERGIILVETRPVQPSSTPTTRSTDDIANLTLTAEQDHAITTIQRAISANAPKTFLLQGITGSGKTEVYIALVRNVLATGGGALVLVPEIALTPQLIARFVKRLSLGSASDVAILHSRMSLRDRAIAWHALQSGTIRLAIGARSAVFAPIENLRLIVVDEEHETTYKQYDKTPRYHARDIAVARAAMLNAVCVLGSATPSLESYYNATTGKYERLELTQRAQSATLPKIEIVDLRTAANRADQQHSRSSITPTLRAAMADRLDKHEAIVLLQNRRGFSTIMECLQCGTPDTCPHCAVTLTYHRPKNRMRCHYCGFSAPKRTTCATCGSDRLRLSGAGTQRVEDDVAKVFPHAKLVRMDRDSTTKQGAYHQMLKAFGDGEADILLGTQMVAKGLDFPRVTLVGVIAADTSLCLPDFRASERTFQLLTQVAGRAGRSVEHPGEVLIQTLQPNHPAITAVIVHDYQSFVTTELSDRAALNYPPFSRLILLEFRSTNERLAEEKANAFASLFPQKANFYERIGPAPATIAKLRNEFRFHILIKNFKQHDPNGEKIRRLLTGATEQFQKRYASPNVKFVIDVDVQGLS